MRRLEFQVSPVSTGTALGNEHLVPTFQCFIIDQGSGFPVALTKPTSLSKTSKTVIRASVPAWLTAVLPMADTGTAILQLRIVCDATATGLAVNAGVTINSWCEMAIDAPQLF
jgi:hypothetical protein